jgi:hypothetical protein
MTISSLFIAEPSFGTSALGSTGCGPLDENSVARAFGPAALRAAGLSLALAAALAACASAPAGGSMTADRAQRVLAAQGYRGLHNLHPADGGFAAEATRDGQPVTVVIDGDGIIHTQ